MVWKRMACRLLGHKVDLAFMSDAQTEDTLAAGYREALLTGDDQNLLKAGIAALEPIKHDCTRCGEDFRTGGS